MNIPSLNAFLIELKFNNSKMWFDANRPRYQVLRSEFVAFVGQLIDGVAEFDASVKDVRPQDTLFRVNRDARFSHDKSPYKTTFSAAISSGGRHSGWPLYYVQIGPDQAFVAGGVYAPTPEALRTVRGYIERYPQKAESLLREPQLLHRFGGLRTEGNLKRFPRGYPQGPELLKYKSFTVGTGLPDLDADGLRALALVHFAAMQPLHAYLRDALAYRAAPRPEAGLTRAFVIIAS